MSSNITSSLSRALLASPVPFDALPAQVAAALPLDLSFTVPSHVSNRLMVKRTSNGVEQPPVAATLVRDDPVAGVQQYLAQMPPLAPGEMVQYAPVLSRVGMVIQAFSPRSTRGVEVPPALPEIAPPSCTGMPRYDWNPEFLGAFTVQMKPPESFGDGPDGMHLTYRMESGEIRGPRLNGKTRGGDWIVLRRDGVAIGDSRVTFEMDDGALLLARYSGMIDTGPDGYERALRNEFAPSPPVVMTPTFVTSHPRWLWLNRLQCIAVGRADTQKLQAKLDIYAIRVGQARG
jgi:hypothetical protein